MLLKGRMECGVCANAFNKTIRKVVVCPYCPEKICVGCHRKYLMSTTEDAHCMSCRTAWPLDVCYSVLPSSFWRDYSIRRAELCVAQEKNLLPETMVQLRREFLHQEMFRTLRSMGTFVGRIETRMSGMRPQASHPGVNTHPLTTSLSQSIQSFHTLKHEYDSLCSPGFIDNAEGVQPEEAEVEVHYLPCPYDGC
jgi:hypothetical protein